MIYLFVMIDLGALEVGIFFSNDWSWLASRVMLLLLLFNFSNMGLSILAWLYGSSELATLATSSSIFFSWPSIVVAVLVLF